MNIIIVFEYHRYMVDSGSSESIWGMLAEKRIASLNSSIQGRWKSLTMLGSILTTPWSCKNNSNNGGADWTLKMADPSDPDLFPNFLNAVNQNALMKVNSRQWIIDKYSSSRGRHPGKWLRVDMKNRVWNSYLCKWKTGPKKVF